MKSLFKLAILSGNIWAVKTQLQQGVQINVPDANGNYPLMLAASKGYLDLCRLLIEKGADIQQENLKGENARFVAKTKGYDDIVQLFELYAPSSKQDTEQDLICFEGLFESGDWECEEAIVPPPEQDQFILEHLKERERVFSIFIPVEDGEDWTDIDLDLPLEQFFKKTHIRLGSEYIDKIQLIISKARQQGCINISCLEYLLEDHVSKNHIIRRLCEVLSAYDIVIIDEPPDLFDKLFRDFDCQQHEIVIDVLDEEIFHEFIWAFKDDEEIIYSYFKNVNYIGSSQQDTIMELVEKRNKSAWELLCLLSYSPREIVDLDSQFNFLAPSFYSNEDQEFTAMDLDEDSYLPIAINFKNLYRSLQQEKYSLRKPYTSSQLFELLGRLLCEIDFVQRCAFYILERLSTTQNEASFDILHWKRKIKFYHDSLTESRKLIVIGNLRLALYFAQKYRGLGCELADLVQEANIGLLRATSKFDSTKNAKFSTYAVWWIRQAIMRYIQNAFNTIRIPCHVLGSAYDRLGQDAHGWELLMDNSTINEEIPSWLNRNNIMSEREEELPLIKIRFDFLTEKEQDGCLNEKQEHEISPESAAYYENMNKHINTMLNDLKEKERHVLKLRFGIQCSAHTLEEIGSHFGLTRERIRQIESKALKKLIHPSRLRILETFI